MRLRGLHLNTKVRRGRMTAQIQLSASFPEPAMGVGATPPPIYSIIPPVIPKKGDPDPRKLYPSWVKSGGTLLPYSATTHVPGFMQPILGPPLLHRMTPMTPLLMLGFGLNLLLYAGEILNPTPDPRWDAV